ncbi:type II toxin-antitoxin system death-on-curing family toxin [Maricaulis sp.]|uniref:type II toxin-antitoxin system death-on-curing family toxin n=1 Tax=unclassified Maricaulis TaxID=2632371 RepID=UPI001B27C3D2|nr:type II toxin-antitoxin system death-on-curing family toxin [Maricaulis sp.]MBO6797030.1 type II toxin-antitoxin system death-on-curing family toxin [Maricaulis sp.]
MRDYLEVELVLEIHAAQIARFGGARGLRDPGQLEAALHRPQTGYYRDIIEEAAALWESLSQNNPFVDGNKRTAFAAMDIFLGLNGYELTADVETAITFILDLYETGTFSFEKLEPWLREHVVLPAE